MTAKAQWTVFLSPPGRRLGGSLGALADVLFPPVDMLYEVINPHWRVLDSGPPQSPGSQCLCHCERNHNLPPLEFPSCVVRRGSGKHKTYTQRKQTAKNDRAQHLPAKILGSCEITTPLVIISGRDILYPLPGGPVKQVLVGIHVRCSLRNIIRVSLFLSKTMRDLERGWWSRWKTPVFRLRYASQQLQI